MTSNSGAVSIIDNKTSNTLDAHNSGSIPFGSTVSYTSLLIVNLQQLQTDLQTQHQHEKNALTELNKQFRHFVDHVQLLESQNSKYIVQLADLRRHAPNSSGFDEQYSQVYTHLQSDLMKISKAKVDHEVDLEISQMQVGIYRLLIDTEQQREGEQHSKLEQELIQSSNILNGLRASYADMGQEVGRLHTTRDDMINTYLRLLNDSCSIRKQIKEWELTIHGLKNHILFYKNVHSSSGR
jgi:chromosome segregation ATPase